MSESDISLNDALAGIAGVYEQGLRKAASVPDDWRYISSRLSDSDFVEFCQAVTAEQMIFISSSSMYGTTRFSLFMSPRGNELLRAHLAQNK